jgi:hypothetical protein
MKQKKAWAQVSVSYKPLDLYKLIESVVLKQTEDQYPVAALWEQYGAVYNAKQGNLTSTEWYERFNAKVEVAESVSCVFANDKTLTYCLELEYKLPYSQLTDANKIVVTNLACDRFIACVCVLTRPPGEKDHWPLPPIKAGWHSSFSP